MTAALGRLRGRGVRQTLSVTEVSIIVLLGLTGFGILTVDGFASPANLLQVLRSQALVGIVAIGMTFIVLSGNFVDLSVPAVVATAANVALAFQDAGAVTAVLLALAIGLAIGVLNGTIVAYMGVNAVIATLGVKSVVAGLLLGWTGGALSRGTVDAFNEFVVSRPLGIPVLVWVFLVLLVIAHLVLARTRFGAQVRLTGGNARAAAISGVPTRLVTVGSFALMGLTAAITGVLLGGFGNQADTAVGVGLEFGALVAVVLGGTALSGGRGGFGRTLVGVLLFGVMSNILQLQGVSTSVQLLALGGVFLLVVGGEAILNARRGARS